MLYTHLEQTCARNSFFQLNAQANRKKIKDETQNYFILAKETYKIYGTCENYG